MAPAPLPVPPNGPVDAQGAQQNSSLDDLRAKLKVAQDERRAAAARFKRAADAAPRTPTSAFSIREMAEARAEEDASDSGVRALPNPEDRVAARRKQLEDSKLIRMRRLRELKAKTMSCVRTVGETTLMNWENELAGEKPELPED